MKFVESLESRTLLAVYAPPTGLRAEISLNSGWKFARSDKASAQNVGYDDSNWSNINLPHTWNAQDGQDGGDDYYRGIGWYRRSYTIPTSYTGKQFYLYFGAGLMTTDVYVNGSLVGEHRGGYQAFNFDLNPYVKVGKTMTIAVRVNNAEDECIVPYYDGDAGQDFTKFGGLYRDVRLQVTDPIHISPRNAATSGIFLKQQNVSSTGADVVINTELHNSGGSARTTSVTATLVDAGNNIVKSVTTGNITISARSTTGLSQTIHIDNPHLWNGVKDPYLYRVHVSVGNGSGVTDAVSQSLGLRYYRMDANKGFLLNGKKYNLRGVSMHQDRLDKGYATSKSDRIEDVQIALEMGATAVRTGHYQFIDHYYDLLDKYGLIAWTAVPLDVNYCDDPAFKTNVQQQLKETMRQLNNHPSFVFVGIGNEVEASAGGLAIINTLQKLAKKEDPSRITVTASNRDTNAETFKFASDLDAFNKYYGWYGSEDANYIKKWLDAVHVENPNNLIALSEYGAGASIHYHAENPGKPTPTRQTFHPEEYQNTFHETYLPIIQARPWLVGTWVWNLFDFASDWRGEGDTHGRNDKGLVTYDRQTKKDSFYLYKAHWTDSPVLHITSRRFTQRTSATTTVKLYTNMESVTLSVNGVKIGSATPNTEKIARFSNVRLASGVNTIKVTGTRNGKSYTDTCQWTYSGSASKSLSVAPALFSNAGISGTSESTADDVLL